MKWDFRDEPAIGDPIEVVDYDPAWPAAFEAERARLRIVFGGLAAAIEHVGSTAVRGLAAKPVIDILVGVQVLPLPERVMSDLASLGYEYRGEDDTPGEHFFRTNPRTRHLRVVELGSKSWREPTEFRDHLRAHPDVARDYAALKQRLARLHRLDRAAYAEGKAGFIRSIVRLSDEA